MVLVLFETHVPTVPALIVSASYLYVVLGITIFVGLAEETHLYIFTFATTGVQQHQPLTHRIR